MNFCVLIIAIESDQQAVILIVQSNEKVTKENGSQPVLVEGISNTLNAELAVVLSIVHGIEIASWFNH